MDSQTCLTQSDTKSGQNLILQFTELTNTNSTRPGQLI